MAGTYQIDTIVLEASISLHMTAGREQALCTVQGEHVRAMVVLTQLNVDSSPGFIWEVWQAGCVVRASSAKLISEGNRDFELVGWMPGGP